MSKYRVLVTGGSRGIGAAVVKLLAAKPDYEVIAPAHSELDLSDRNSVEKFLKSLKPVDALANVAGVNLLRSLDEITDRDLQAMLSVNLLSPLKLIQGVAEGMRKRGGGRIVTFSSIWGVRSKERRTLYSITKFGVNGMSRALARELGRDGILLNCIAPGYVLTEMTERNVSPKEQTRLCKEIPLGRMAQPSEIAHVVDFLLSPENTYLTGQTVVVDGGFLA